MSEPRLTEEVGKAHHDPLVPECPDCYDWLYRYAQALAATLAAVEGERDSLQRRFNPIVEEARKTFEFLTMDILLNGGTNGGERLSQIIVAWHKAEAYMHRLRELVGEFCELTDKVCWAEPELSQYRTMRASLRELLAYNQKEEL